MKKVSKKQARLNREKSKLKKKLLEDHPYCDVTGGNRALTLSHLVPVSHNKSLEVVEENVRLHTIHAHHLWEHNKKGFNKLYPEKFCEYMDVIKELDPEYFGLITMKM